MKDIKIGEIYDSPGWDKYRIIRKDDIRVKTRIIKTIFCY